MKNGAGVDAVEADAGAVGGDGEGLGDVAAVDLDGVVAGAALVEVAAVAGVPDHPVVARLAEDLVVARAAGQHVVAGAAEQQVVPPLPSRVSLPAWPKSWSAPEPPVSVSLPAPPKRFAFGRAPLASSRVMVSLPPWPKTWIRRGVGDGGRAAEDRHGAAVDQDRPGRVAADGDGVVVAVAQDGQCAELRHEDRGHGEVAAGFHRFEERLHGEFPWVRVVKRIQHCPAGATVTTRGGAGIFPEVRVDALFGAARWRW